MLARTALRFATLEALRPTASITGNGPWPTTAGAYVFDSRLDPLEDLKPGGAQPTICVYTDEDEGSSGQKAGGPPFKQIVELCLELSVIASAPSDADPDVFVAGVPETDAELEASLDLIEAQVRFILFFGSTGEIWRELCGRKVSSIRSTPSRSSEEGARLAMRRSVWKVELVDDVYDPAPVTSPTGVARLPDPLKTVIAALLNTAYGAKIGAGLAGAAPVMPIAAPLKTVTLNEKLADPTGALPASPNVAAEVDNLDH